MRNLITYEEISSLARPCSADREMAEAMIAEAQRVEIKPRLGDALYLRILEGFDVEDIIYDGGSASVEGDVEIAYDAGALVIIGGEDAFTASSKFDILLNGGRWTSSCGELRLLTGVKTALAYYALARIVRDGNIQASTYGSVIKDDQYSSDPEKAERQRQYRELFGQADGYMAEALSYLSSNCKRFPEYKVAGKVAGKMRSNRMRIRIIGR